MHVNNSGDYPAHASVYSDTLEFIYSFGETVRCLDGLRLRSAAEVLTAIAV